PGGRRAVAAVLPGSFTAGHASLRRLLRARHALLTHCSPSPHDRPSRAVRWAARTGQTPARRTIPERRPTSPGGGRPARTHDRVDLPTYAGASGPLRGPCRRPPRGSVARRRTGLVARRVNRARMGASRRTGHAGPRPASGADRYHRRDASPPPAPVAPVAHPPDAAPRGPAYPD